MKQIALTLLLLLCAFALMANSWDTLSLIRTHIPPTYAGFTFYDYQAGAYEGYPFRIQDANVAITDPANPRAAVLTYMKTVTGSTIRRQVRTALRFEPNPQDPDDLLFGNDSINLNTWQVHEGFGTMVMDKTYGSPIIAWHNWQGVPDTADNPNIWITSEMNGMMENEFAASFTAPYKLYANDPTDEKESWQWPVTLSGPSPTPGKTRIYVFASNGGSSMYMPAPTNPNGYWPSSAEAFKYCDVPNAFFEYGLSFDPADPHADYGYTLEWSEIQRVPFFWEMHNFDPTQYPELQDADGDWMGVRRFGSVAVQQNGPGIAYAGEISGAFYGDHVWEAGYGEHTFYVVYNSNYGAEDAWHVYFFDLSERERIDTTEGFGWYWTTPAHVDSESTYQYHNAPTVTDAQGYTHYGNTNYQNKTWGLGHKNVVFDEEGNIQFPFIMADSFSHDGVDEVDINTELYWYPTSNVVWMAKLNPSNLANPTISIFPISPRPEPGLQYEDPLQGFVNVQFPMVGTFANPPKAPLGWDFNNDGWFDPQFHFDDEDGDTHAGWKGQWPVNHYGPDYQTYSFHCDWFRMTYDCDGVMVAVWADSYKDHAYTENYYPEPEEEDGMDYANYEGIPELMISASMDHGANWSKPYSINNYKHPELFTSEFPDRYVTYAYPADKVIKLGPNSFRLYLMTVTDYSYGTFATMETPIGSNLGAEIQYMAFDFAVLPGSGEFDVVESTPPPQKMLSQNYPNPFNPSTTIKFNLPKTSNVKLDVYNIKGQHVRTLENGLLNQGVHSVVWNGTDDNNQNVASGVYFYRLTANGQSETKKMLLMK